MLHLSIFSQVFVLHWPAFEFTHDKEIGWVHYFSTRETILTNKIQKKIQKSLLFSFETKKIHWELVGFLCKKVLFIVTVLFQQSISQSSYSSIHQQIILKVNLCFTFVAISHHNTSSFLNFVLKILLLSVLIFYCSDKNW